MPHTTLNKSAVPSEGGSNLPTVVGAMFLPLFNGLVSGVGRGGVSTETHRAVITLNQITVLGSELTPIGHT